MALLATAEGPSATPATDVGKIFAAIIAFFSIGAAISAITFTFGPLFGSVLKVGARYLEKEEDRLKDKLDIRTRIRRLIPVEWFPNYFFMNGIPFIIGPRRFICFIIFRIEKYWFTSSRTSFSVLPDPCAILFARELSTKRGSSTSFGVID